MRLQLTLACVPLYGLLISATFLGHLHRNDRSINAYIAYFVGLLNGADDAVEVFQQQRKRATSDMKRLLASRQRAMQERRREARSSGEPPLIGDLQWQFGPDSYQDLQETVGDRLLKCIASDPLTPPDIRETVSKYTYKAPLERRRHEVDELQLDDPRLSRRQHAKGCLLKYEADMLAFLREHADEDGEAYLAKFAKLLRKAQSYHSAPLYAGERDDREGTGLAWWAILLIVLLCLLVLGALVGLGYWFFRVRRREIRAKTAAAGAAARFSA